MFIELLFRKFTVLIYFLLLTGINSFSQIYNSEVEGKISLETNNEFIKITGSAFNKTQISQSLRFVLSIIKTNPQNSNTSKNDQSGRFVLQAYEKVNLASTTLNTDQKVKIIILLLIYDLDEKIVGKDRIVLNEDPNAEDPNLKSILEKNKEFKEIVNEDVDQSASDGIVLTGIVLEDTKTKAGRDFYKYFYSAYMTNGIDSEKIITISETLALGVNTRIQVKIENTVLMEFFARPKDDFLKAMADTAIRKVYTYIQNLEKEKQMIMKY